MTELLLSYLLLIWFVGILVMLKYNANVISLCSWYLWALLVALLLLNVHGWHVYVWLSLAPLILLLVVGSKMEHIITELAVEVVQKHTAIEGDVVVAPSDDFFWFHRPKLVLLLIHIVLFQNAFEIAFFFWLLVRTRS